LTRIANTPQTGSTVSYAHQYNDANLRIRTALADGSYWVYQYDDLEKGAVLYVDNSMPDFASVWSCSAPGHVSDRQNYGSKIDLGSQQS